MSSVVSTLLPYLPAILGFAGSIGTALINKSGSNSSAMNQQGQSQTITNTQAQQTTQQTSNETGSSTQTGNTNQLGGILRDAMTTATGNNAGTAANFNAGQAQTANNLQAAGWTLANIINQWSVARSNQLNQESQTAAMKYNASEAQKQRDWQENLANTSYQRGVKDLKTAGLNPVLAAYNGYGANTPSGGYGSAGIQSFEHAQAAALPTAHTATMQAMYDYGNNTSQFLNNAMATINNAKQTNDWKTASEMENVMHNISSTSAKTVSNLAQQAKTSYQETESQSNETKPRAENKAAGLFNGGNKNKGGGKFHGAGAGRGR